MRDFSKTNLFDLDYTALSPAEQEACRWEAIRRAQDARAELLLESLTGIGAAFRAVRDTIAGAARRSAGGYKTRRRIRAEFAQLKAVGDRALKDIGLTRCNVAEPDTAPGRPQHRQTDRAGIERTVGAQDIASGLVRAV